MAAKVLYQMHDDTSAWITVTPFHDLLGLHIPCAVGVLGASKKEEEERKRMKRNGGAEEAGEEEDGEEEVLRRRSRQRN